MNKAIANELRKREAYDSGRTKLLRELNYDENIVLSSICFGIGKGDVKKFVLKQNGPAKVISVDSDEMFRFTPPISDDEVPEEIREHMKSILSNKMWMPFSLNVKEDEKSLSLFVPENFDKQILQMSELSEAKGVFDTVLMNDSGTHFKTEPQDTFVLAENVITGIYNIKSIRKDKVYIIMKSKDDENSGHFVLSKNKMIWELEKCYRPGAIQKADIDTMKKINELRETHSVSKIAEITNLSVRTVYNYLSMMDTGLVLNP